jgi:hypothetical protein
MSFRTVLLYTTVVLGFSRTHFLRIVPWGSMRKKVRVANMPRSLRTP